MLAPKCYGNVTVLETLFFIVFACGKRQTCNANTIEYVFLDTYDYDAWEVDDPTLKTLGTPRGRKKLRNMERGGHCEFQPYPSRVIWMYTVDGIPVTLRRHCQSDVVIEGSIRQNNHQTVILQDSLTGTQHHQSFMDADGQIRPLAFQRVKASGLYTGMLIEVRQEQFSFPPGCWCR